MRDWHRSIVGAAVLVAAMAAAGAARAGRPTCDELLAELDTGRPREDVAADYGTTHARLDACTRVAQQRERFTERRERVERHRAQRASTP